MPKGFTFSASSERGEGALGSQEGVWAMVKEAGERVAEEDEKGGCGHGKRFAYRILPINVMLFEFW